MSIGVQSLIAVAVGIVALYGMQHTTPYYSDIVSSVEIKAAQGKPVSTDKFTMGVADVHMAKEIVIPSFNAERVYRTDGQWLVIEAVAKANNESTSLSSAFWRGPSGIRYTLSARPSLVPGLIGSERLEPGIPRPVLLIFEVPEKEVEGGTLLVADSLVNPLSQQAAIAMAPVEAKNRHQSVVIKRAGKVLPWTLEFR